MELLTIEDGKIKLNTGLSEAQFCKTNYSTLTGTPGLFFDGENFLPWTFSEIVSDENYVYFSGKNPLSDSAVTAAASLLSEDRECIFKGAGAICSTLTAAARQNVHVPVSGAGAILLDFSKEKPQMLFLPENLFYNAAVTLPKESFFEQCGAWINNSLTDLAALDFFRSVTAYKMLTGAFPFASSEPAERDSDISDNNFLPVQIYSPDLPEELSNAINHGLKVINPPQKKDKFSYEKINEGLLAKPDFPSDLLNTLSDKVILPSESKALLGEKAQNFARLQNSKINTKRKIRRNSGIIGVSAAILLFVSVLIFAIINSKGQEFTSKGLTSVQTIQTFFQAVNSQSSVYLGNISKGKKAENFVKSVIEVHVTSKNRQTYYRDNGLLSLEEYLVKTADPRNLAPTGIFGVSNIKVDGKPVSLDVQPYLTKDKPAPLTKEGSITLEKGSQSVHKVEYYFIRTGGDDYDIYIDKITENFTLTFLKGRWFVTDITSLDYDLDNLQPDFPKDYKAALANNQNDITLAVAELKPKYPWLP